MKVKKVILVVNMKLNSEVGKNGSKRWESTQKLLEADVHIYNFILLQLINNIVNIKMYKSFTNLKIYTGKSIFRN